MSNSNGTKFFYKRVSKRKQKCKKELECSQQYNYDNYYAHFQPYQQLYYDPWWEYNNWNYHQQNEYFNDNANNTTEEHNIHNLEKEYMDSNPFIKCDTKPIIEKKFVSLTSPRTIKNLIDLINENNICDEIEYNI